MVNEGNNYCLITNNAFKGFVFSKERHLRILLFSFPAILFLLKRKYILKINNKYLNFSFKQVLCLNLNNYTRTLHSYTGYY